MKRLLEEHRRVGLDRVLELAHRHLGIDAVYIAELTSDCQIYRAVAGDARSFKVAVGDSSAEATYSQLLLSGEIDALIPDTSLDSRVANLRATVEAGIGSFIGVPLLLSDGRLYGTLCGIDHDPDQTLGERDVRFMAMLAELVVYDLDEQRRQEQLRVGLMDVIETNNVDIACQPIIDLRTGGCLGFEALARFSEPFGSPDQTFAEAEEVGLGLELERLTIREAWKLLPLLGPEQFLALNVSPGALVELAGRALKRDDLPLSSLVIEVTEQSIVRSYPELRSVLEPLRKDGLRIAIDDAGAGYASLHHVVELRPDFIKVDRSLVDGVADDHARRVAVSAFVLLSLDLGATVVAEGVERPRDLSTLCDLGVQAAQGYLLGRPSTRRDDLTRWSETPPSRTGIAPEGAGRQTRSGLAHLRMSDATIEPQG